MLGKAPPRDNGMTRTIAQPAVRRHVGRWCQLDMQRAQQAGQTDCRSGVLGKDDIAVQAHRHERVPALALDLRQCADVDVADADSRVGLDVVDVGQLGLDHERAVATALGAGHRQGVQPAPVAATGYPDEHRDRDHAAHGAPTRVINRHRRWAPSGRAGPRWGRSPPRHAPARRACASAAQRRLRRGRHEVGSHPVLAVGDLVGPGLRTDQQVLADRREVVLPVLDDRGQVLDAQLRRLLGIQP